VRYDIFISYAREDGPRVGPLLEELRRRGYRVFLDVESIGVGERWKQRLEGSIRASRALLLCWSVHARLSEFVQFEYLKAESAGKKVMPWLLDETPLPAMVELQGITALEPAVVADAVAARIGWTLNRRRLLAVCATGLVMVVGAGASVVWMKLEGFDLHGEVADENGLPLAGAEVVAEPGFAMTDVNGHYALHVHGPRPDYMKLRFRKAGYTEESMNVPTGELFRMVMVKVKTSGK